MEKNLKIEKLSDIVVWADNWITNLKDGLTEEEIGEDEAVNEFETIKKVVLESMERHSVYTDALNKDIADKAAKIDLLEKEIEGRKEGYIALKVRMDTKYISIEEHNNICEDFKKKIAELEKESEKWQDLANMNRDTIVNQYEVCEDFKKKIAELEKELSDRNVKIRHQMALINELADKNDEIKSLKEENSYLKSEIKQKQNIIKKAYERYSDDIIKTRKDVLEVAYRDIEKDNGYVGFKLYVKSALREAKGNKEEANEVITEAVRFFYREWDKEQKENEETIEKAINEVKSLDSGVPCGSDAIE